MIEEDTIKLLRECNAGIKMAVTAIDDVLPSTTLPELKAILEKSKKEHERIGDETHKLLNEYHDKDKEPSAMAKAMSWVSINLKLLTDDTDHKVSDLIVDGCNMGVKSLSKYLNKYKAADERSKDLTKELIAIEEKLSVDLREYL